MHQKKQFNRSRQCCRGAFLCAVLFSALATNLVCGAQPATPAEAISSNLDVWGEAALTRPEGPTYEYFASLLPPIRYVDAQFHHYPIVLSAPEAAAKGRVLSNGSQINALAREPLWKHEMGIPVHILVGEQRKDFGDDLSQLDGPHYADGYLPVVQFDYKQAGLRYEQEVFAATSDALTSVGAIMARFNLPDDNSRIELQLEAGYELMRARGGLLRNAAGECIANFDENWEPNPFRNALVFKPRNSHTATVAIYTTPLDAVSTPPRMSAQMYDRERANCMKTWSDILARGMQVEVPEPYVNNAWRSLLVGDFEIIIGDQLNYSAGNQYARTYASETGDAMRSLLLWGFAQDVRRMLPPLLRKERSNMEFHYAGFELQSLAEYFNFTHDLDFLREMRPVWEKSLKMIEAGREESTGMLPREQYCTDIDKPVYNLVSNSMCWRAMRDMALVLADTGETSRGEQLAATAAGYRKTILTAIDRATSVGVAPRFIPVALGGEEAVHDPITATRIGSYWNLVIGFVLGSGVFPYDSQTTTDILRYQQTHGGICMGMIRNLSEPSFWMNPKNIDDLYGVRYALMLQQRDEADRALVSFYGKLAQGFTRDTFMDGESTCLTPYDPFGRQVFLPPNSAANASFLQQLRCLLVQDWDMDDDGRADTLRLLFATPRAWLADGKSITVDRAPTLFGSVSLKVTSHLDSGTITADLSLPASAPKVTLLKLRLPLGKAIVSARTSSLDLKVTSETVNLSGLTGMVHLTATVR